MGLFDLWLLYLSQLISTCPLTLAGVEFTTMNFKIISNFPRSICNNLNPHINWKLICELKYDKCMITFQKLLIVFVYENYGNFIRIIILWNNKNRNQILLYRRDYTYISNTFTTLLFVLHARKCVIV